MITQEFEFRAPDKFDDALSLLAEGGDDIKLLSGGMSLMPMMALGLVRPRLVLSLNRIDGRSFVREDRDALRIGAGTRHYEILHDPLVARHCAVLAEAAAFVGDMQVRNRGTIGGSLAHADPAADWPALILASDAVIEVLGSGGSRSIKATDFFTGLFSTALQENEIITAIRIPVPEEGTRTVYLKYSNPASRFAVVGCAVVRFPGEKTNIAFTGVADTPFRDTAAEKAVSGKALDEANIKEAANAAAEGVHINGDLFASSEYRKHLAKVFLKRALLAVA